MQDWLHVATAFMSGTSDDWVPCSREEKAVVAIANFSPLQYPDEVSVNLLSFRVGDVLHATRKCGDWLLGQYSDNNGFTGIFPRSFVASLKQYLERPGSGDEFDPKDDPIVPEMARVLREWHPMWKQKFARCHLSFHEIRGMMLEMLKIRREILFSGKVTVERMQELKSRIIYLIDLGNSKLGLDLVVRDAKGNSLNPEKISAVELFYLHEKIAVQTKTRKDSRISLPPLARAPPASHIRSYKLSVKLGGVSVAIKHRFQLLIALYHQNSSSNMVQFTEPFVIEWSLRDSFLRFDGGGCNDSALFTDLNVRDLDREHKPHVVIFLLRLGAMDPVLDPRRKPATGPSADLRRPVGVAVKDISEIMVPTPEGFRGYRVDDTWFQFTLCGEKESLSETLLKCFNARGPVSKETQVRLSLHLFDKETEETVTMLERNAQEAKKIGFPEVVLPEYCRSDIFVTIHNAELTKAKNVEVNVSVFDEEGNLIHNVIHVGAGLGGMSDYRSVVYYQQDKPKWMETFRIELPTELFAKAHLRFILKHRSRNDGKEKLDVPFAVSYLRLVEPKSTILRDARYELALYRLTSVGEKSWQDHDVSYTSETLGMFSLRSNINEGTKLSTKKFTVNAKEVLRVSTAICSTKLTYDVHLMSLLKWQENPENVKTVLQELRHVNPAEIVKFLRDTLDAIFSVMMHFKDVVDYDEEVFDALVHVISKMNEVQYEQFKGVMNSYIEETFHATLAHKKLLRIFKLVIRERTELQELQNILKATQFMFKFIVKSRILAVQCPVTIAGNEQEFEEEVVQVFKSMAELMTRTDPGAPVYQCFCLKHLPQATADLITVISPLTLSTCWAEILSNVKRSQRSTQFLTTMREIVASPLFKNTPARAAILPVMCRKIAERLTLEHETKLKTTSKAKKILGDDFKTVDDGLPEEMELTVKLLGDILEFLWKSRDQSVDADVHLLADELLIPIVKLIFGLPAGERYQQIMEFLVVILTSLLRQMSTHHFECFFAKMSTGDDRVLQDFLVELLNLFVNLITNPVFPKEWGDMIILRSSVILKTVKCIGVVMKDRFPHCIVIQLWDNYFKCAVQFITDPSLQLETFSPAKKAKIISRYKDMRKTMADEVRTMWMSLEMQKIRFIPRIVKDFLEMTLVPDPELRRETLKIFYDMMLCEFCSPPPPGATGLGFSYRSSKTFSVGDGAFKERTPIRGNFKEFENEVIAQLDALIETGKGDDHYRHLFKEILGEMCSGNQHLREMGPEFVKKVSSLMKKLLMFRGAVGEESVNNVMSCAEILLEFYRSIEQRKLHIKYVYKLFDLHKEEKNLAEAAYTLLEHYNLLEWKTVVLPYDLAPPKCGFDARGCVTYDMLKFKVANEAMSLFEEAKLWEPAIKLCEDICKHCTNHTFNYLQLSTVLERQASYYKSIVMKERFVAEYYRVAFYGRGFPSFLQNKEFICRGSVFERLAEFQSRTMNQFPNAELMKTLDEPTQEQMSSPCQLIQINQVSPVENPNLFGGNKEIDDKILNYYRNNEVDQFVYSRRLERNSRGANEFANLWQESTVLKTCKKLPGIIVWSAVKRKDRKTLTPIESALAAMNKDNDKLSTLLRLFRGFQVSRSKPSPSAMNELSLVLGGRLDAAVMGGIKNYEDAFFTPQYLDEKPEDAVLVEDLKKLLVTKAELLGELLKIKAIYLDETTREWFELMSGRYEEMKAHMKAEYSELLSDEMRVSTVEPVSAQLNVTQSTPEHSGSWMEAIQSQSLMQRTSSNVMNTLRRAKKPYRMTSTTSDAPSSSQAPERSNAIRRKSSIEPDSDAMRQLNHIRSSCFELPTALAPPLPQKMTRHSDGPLASSNS